MSPLIFVFSAETENVTCSSVRVVATLLMEWERVRMELPARSVSKLWTKVLTKKRYSSPEMVRLPLVSVPASVARTESSWVETEVTAFVLRERIFNFLRTRLAAVSSAMAAVADQLPPLNKQLATD